MLLPLLPCPSWYTWVTEGCCRADVLKPLFADPTSAPNPSAALWPAAEMPSIQEFTPLAVFCAVAAVYPAAPADVAQVHASSCPDDCCMVVAARRGHCTANVCKPGTRVDAWLH
jgi:hypothetical protein